jgi:hypothetical protein
MSRFPRALGLILGGLFHMRRCLCWVPCWSLSPGIQKFGGIDMSKPILMACLLFCGATAVAAQVCRARAPYTMERTSR